jgi:O6-methylguanine-DNA--protein-cysteine methyltransferase
MTVDRGSGGGPDLVAALRGLADPDPDAPGGGPGPAADGFALRVLQRVGIPADRYDTYVLLETAAGGLYVASSGRTVTGALLSQMLDAPRDFEERHRLATGRAALPGIAPPPAVRTALRTGRARQLPIALDGLAEGRRAVLEAVRAVPAGQLRPLSWVAREAGVSDVAAVLDALACNPVQILVPCHRVSYEDGVPCDAAHGVRAGEALRRAEGIDIARLETYVRARTAFIGSDTTGIFCHPTCAHARRITAPHEVPFHDARAARHAGYRPCRSCRPVAA